MKVCPLIYYLLIIDRLKSITMTTKETEKNNLNKSYENRASVIKLFTAVNFRFKKATLMQQYCNRYNLSVREQQNKLLRS